MRRSLLISFSVAGVLVLVAGGAAYLYFFSGIRAAPKPLALTSPSPAATASTPPAGRSGLIGSWAVAPGSLAGYRVKEQFVGQTSPHEAVARTSAMSGGVAVQEGASGLQATALHFVADVAQLQSVDQVAGYNVSNRDRIVSRTLEVQQFPQASFQAQLVALPAALASGQQVTVSVPGKVTIHGATRDATATVQVQMAGAQVEAAGSLPVDMADFGITPPSVPFTKAESKVSIEFQLVLARA